MTALLDSPFSAILAVPAVVLLAVVWLARLKSTQLPRIPVYPALSVPFLGHMLDLLFFFAKHKSFEAWATRVVDRTGGHKLVQTDAARKHAFVICTDPELIDKISASTDYDAADPVIETFNMIPKAMFGRKSDKMYKFHRLAFVYSHSAPFLALAGEYFTSHFDLLLAQWSESASKGTFFSVEDDVRRLTTDVIAQLSFGESFGQIKSGGDSSVAQAMATLTSLLSGSVFMTLRNWIARRRPSYQRAYATFEHWYAARVDHARDRIRDGGEIAEIQCLIDIVMRKEARDGEGNVMPEDELRDEMFAAMLAGQESSGTAESWAFKHLSEHPEVQHKLRDSLVSVLPLPSERAPTVADVGPEATPYLEAVAHEILRLSGVAPVSERQAIRDTTLPSTKSDDAAPHHIPSGTIFCLLNYHAAIRAVPDGAIFRPERWLNEKGNFDGTLAWSRPFGSGTRMCYGYRTALVFLRLFLAQLSLTYFVRELPEELRAQKATNSLTRRPDKSFVGLSRWDDVGEGEGGVAKAK